MVANRADGQYSFVHVTWSEEMTYTGRFVDGLRDGPWLVTHSDGTPAWEVTWKAGQWHGRAITWWRNGEREHEGTYDLGRRAGAWSFWFESSQLAAQGNYLADRKVGDWKYFDDDGTPMDHDHWATKFDQWDWAYDDYTGFPRGENWPEPPPHAEPMT